MEKLKCVLLIDDNEGDNYFNNMLIKEMDIAEHIQLAQDGLQAINYLKDEKNVFPELIFLDINMPVMNGWEFLKQYKKLNEKKKGNTVVVILATIGNSDEINAAPEIDLISKFELKPLNKRSVKDILTRYLNK